MPSDQQWFANLGETEIGPVSTSDLRALAASGQITRETLIRLGPSGAWVPASKAKGLFPATPAPYLADERLRLLERDFRTLQQQHQWLEQRYQVETAQLTKHIQTLEERARYFQQGETEVKHLGDAILQLRCDQQVLALEYEQQQESLRNHRAEVASHKQQIVSDYHAAKAVYDRLRAEINLLEENVEDISFGLYKPHFEFDTAEGYKRELERVRDARKLVARTDTATKFLVEWQVDGSRVKGIQMQKQISKLLLRAFNGETDAAIANCRWNNVTRMKERIRRSHLAINRLGIANQVHIVDAYRDFALQELQLEFEYQEKKRAEAEEQREIRERMREEERAQREYERAEAEAAAEELRFSKALAKARDDVAKAHGQMTSEQALRIAELERQLADAHSLHERAISMAQLTRCGHVYIISNVGSFGENMYKIGLTHRLEPTDRVRELGDASVPFAFDVHAMVYSEDAPALENALHREFNHKRVNMINARKEFFHVSLEEIERFVQERGLDIKLTMLAEAREYRETLTLRAKPSAGGAQPIFAEPAFPEELVREGVGVSSQA